jgi:hypothetical protein
MDIVDTNGDDCMEVDGVESKQPVRSEIFVMFFGRSTFPHCREILTLQTPKETTVWKLMKPKVNKRFILTFLVMPFNCSTLPHCREMLILWTPTETTVWTSMKPGMKNQYVRIYISPTFSFILLFFTTGKH